MSPCLTLGIYLGSVELFVFLCHLCLAGTSVFPSATMFQIPVVDEFDFHSMIHAHLLGYFLNHTLSLLAIVNLGIELLLVDALYVHHFVDKFVPLAVISALDEDTHLTQILKKLMTLLLMKNMRIHTTSLMLKM